MDFSWEKWENAVKGKSIIGYGTGANAHLMLYSKRFQSFIKQLDFFVDIDNRKHGKKFLHGNYEYEIKSVEHIYNGSDFVVIVTNSDYVKIGNMLDKKNIIWFPWVVISIDVNLDEMFKYKNNIKTSIFLMNTPAYINLGDHAIAVAEDDYLGKNFGEYYEFNSHQCNFQIISKLTNYISEKDILFFQGGGNLGSLWCTNEETFRNILVTFPDNPVIVFPQSIYYGDTEGEKEYFRKSQEIYNSHKNLLICVRDRRSYDFVTNSYSCRCMLLPDMVMRMNYQSQMERKGIGVLLRHDKEQLLSNEYESTIDKVISELGEDKIIIDHQPDKFINDRRQEIALLMKKYSQCKLIITDRLHGMILSAVTGTPCIAFDNSYHKVSDLYETWFMNNPNIAVSESMTESELLKCSKEKLLLKHSYYDNNQFTEKYNSLTNHIRKLM